MEAVSHPFINKTAVETFTAGFRLSLHVLESIKTSFYIDASLWALTRPFLAPLCGCTSSLLITVAIFYNLKIGRWKYGGEKERQYLTDAPDKYSEVKGII